MSKNSYAIGAYLGRHKFIVAGVALALVAYAMWPSPPVTPTKATALPESTSPPAMTATAKLPSASAPDPCETGTEARLINARALMTAGKPDAAFDLLHPCQSTLSAEAKALYGKALTQGNAKREKAADAEAKRVRAEKKREGVRVGMSEQDALDSSWGRPRKVNRTTNAYGVSEQWVYDGGYLYFKDGVLTSIQN